MTHKKNVATAIICLTALEITAICAGFNGTLFTFVVGAICALVGISLPTPKILKD